jgi:hypothetical protein
MDRTKTARQAAGCRVDGGPDGRQRGPLPAVAQWVPVCQGSGAPTRLQQRHPLAWSGMGATLKAGSAAGNPEANLAQVAGCRVRRMGNFPQPTNSPLHAGRNIPGLRSHCPAWPCSAGRLRVGVSAGRPQEINRFCVHHAAWVFRALQHKNGVSFDQPPVTRQLRARNDQTVRSHRLTSCRCPWLWSDRTGHMEAPRSAIRARR